VGATAPLSVILVSTYAEADLAEMHRADHRCVEFPVRVDARAGSGAIAAGNAVVLKPSEVSPTSSALMAVLVARYLDNEAIAVIEGDGAVSQRLFAQGFDRILFTGGTEIGRKVYESAAHHLTPVTLELGGKSPVILAGDADMVDVAAKRIAWTQAGQLGAGVVVVVERAGLCVGRRQDSRQPRQQDR
jgi:acyl-CoA reductase-like NAD-dependent aldehyde dehydrogenase